ncbi:hypothetical protein [Novosphingopyxis sp. YJ-S2-01]|uniref:hypothetical protein n=1 Tax=Novosphingopyxis sp. YJ-S2-01 TaxID=2794021 RepID=UPI0018DE01F4|nr:hypothetical protein [Novosphingopyxis sp. YJ-S2-01]
MKPVRTRSGSILRTPAELAEWAFNYVRVPGGTVWFELGRDHQKHLAEMAEAIAERVSA